MSTRTVRTAVAGLMVAGMMAPATPAAQGNFGDACMSFHGEVFLRNFAGGPPVNDVPGTFYVGVEGQPFEATVSPMPGCGDINEGGTSTASYTTENGSATAGGDYTHTEGTTEPMCDDIDSWDFYCEGVPRSRPIDVELNADGIEDDLAVETFLIKLTSGSRGISRGHPNPVPVYLVDVDGPARASLQPGADAKVYPRIEAGRIRLPVFLAGTNPPSSVGFTVEGEGSHPATPGADFTCTPGCPGGSGNLPIGSSRVEFVQVNFVRDDAIEGTERIRLSITSPGVASGEPSSTLIDITDLSKDEIAPVSRLLAPKNGVKYKWGDKRIRELKTTTTDEGVETIGEVEIALQKKVAGGKCAWWNGTKFGATAKNCATKRWLPMGSPAGRGPFLPQDEPAGGHGVQDQELHRVDARGRLRWQPRGDVHARSQPEHLPGHEEEVASARSDSAASTIDRIFPRADSRGRYFIPQSGARTRRSGSTTLRARRTRSATTSGVSTVSSERSMTPRMVVLSGRSASTPGVEIRLRGLDRDLIAGAVRELGQKRVARGLVVNDRRVPETDVHGRRTFGVLEGPVQCVQAEAARRVGSRLHVGLIQLHDVSPGREEVTDLGVARLGVSHGNRFVVRVVVVLRLLRHRERARHRHLHAPVRVAAEKLEVRDAHRFGAAYGANDARDRVRVTATVQRGSGIVDVDALERRCEVIRVALAPDLSVGDDVEPRVHLVPNRLNRGVGLRFGEMLGTDPPQLARANPGRETRCKLRPVDQPLRLWVATGERGHEERAHEGINELESINSRTRRP